MEVKKITDHQLKKITQQQQQLNNVLSNIGVLEVQKQNLAQQVKDISEEIEKTKSELEEEYGKVSINLSDGTYEPIKDEQEDANSRLERGRNFGGIFVEVFSGKFRKLSW